MKHGLRNAEKRLATLEKRLGMATGETLPLMSLKESKIYPASTIAILLRFLKDTLLEEDFKAALKILKIEEKEGESLMGTKYVLPTGEVVSREEYDAAVEHGLELFGEKRLSESWRKE